MSQEFDNLGRFYNYFDFQPLPNCKMCMRGSIPGSRALCCKNSGSKSACVILPTADDQSRFGRTSAFLCGLSLGLIPWAYGFPYDLAVHGWLGSPTMKA